LKVVGLKFSGNACRGAALAAALALGGCASGDTPIPLPELSMPSIPIIPANNPASNAANTPETFPAIAPPAEREGDQPVMNDVERLKLEGELRKLGTQREAEVKQRIERAN
jgi:hypothetical protein